MPGQTLLRIPKERLPALPAACGLRTRTPGQLRARVARSPKAANSMKRAKQQSLRTGYGRRNPSRQRRTATPEKPKLPGNRPAETRLPGNLTH
nr:hypothetical protein [Blautia sp.]